MKQVLEVDSSDVAMDAQNRAHGVVQDAAGDDGEEPTDGAGETTHRKYTCCALKCCETFISPDALRYLLTFYLFQKEKKSIPRLIYQAFERL